ncbi:MAG: hypothetical protein ACREB9_08385 [Thermoplasmata archaeon]
MRRSRRGIAPVVIAVVVVIVVVGASVGTLFALGVLKLPGSAGGGGPSSPTYRSRSRRRAYRAVRRGR